MTKRAASLFIGLYLLTVVTHSASAQTDECGRMRNARREGENQMMALLASPLMTREEQLAAAVRGVWIPDTIHFLLLRRGNSFRCNSCNR
jgi:hypothetical protein